MSSRAARRPRRLPRAPLPLALLLAVAAVLSVSWTVLVPPLQGPDEDAHVSYVQRLVETRELPQQIQEGAPGVSSELRIVLRRGGLFELPTNPAMRPHGTQAERDAFEREVDALGAAGRADGTGPQPANVNPPLYYAFAAVGYVAGLPGDFFARQTTMRLLGVPLLLLTVVMTWLLVAELIPRPYSARALAAAVVALHPVAGFMSGVVNPDVALMAAWSAFFYLAARTVRHGVTMRRALLLGAVAAVSALIQPRGLTLGFPAVVALAVALWHHRVPWRAALRPAGALLAVALGGVVLYWLSLRAGGGESSSNAGAAIAGSGGFSPRQFVSYLWQFYFPPWRFMEALPGNILGFRYVWVESFFGVFGSLDVYLPTWVLGRLYTASVWGLVVLVVLLVLRWDVVRRHRAVLFVLVAAALTYLLGLHYAAYNSVVGSAGQNSVLVGRYLLPLLPLMGLAIAFVARSLPRRWGTSAGVAVVVTGLVLSLAALGQAFVRYYA